MAYTCWICWTFCVLLRTDPNEMLYGMKVWQEMRGRAWSGINWARSLLCSGVSHPFNQLTINNSTRLNKQRTKASGTHVVKRTLTIPFIAPSPVKVIRSVGYQMWRFSTGEEKKSQIQARPDFYSHSRAVGSFSTVQPTMLECGLHNVHLNKGLKPSTGGCVNWNSVGACSASSHVGYSYGVGVAF